MNADEAQELSRRERELCHIAEELLGHLNRLEDTLKVMETTLCTTIDKSSMTIEEKKVASGIVKRVAPTGMKSLLNAINLTTQRNRHLYVEQYQDAAKRLVETIYQQSGIAGPTSERTFNSKADAKHAAAVEVANNTHTVPHPKKTVVSTAVAIAIEGEGKKQTDRYKKLVKSHPQVAAVLDKVPKPPVTPLQEWLTVCGYVQTDSTSAKATLGRGLDAVMWPNNNVVIGVAKYPHPSCGDVFILRMENPTTGEEENHLKDVPNCKVWAPVQHRCYIVVEISPRGSKTSPFINPREKWGTIIKYLESAKHNTGVMSLTPP